MIVSWIAKRVRFLQIATDLLLVSISWACAYAFRFELLGGGQGGLDTLFVAWYFPLAIFTHYFFLKNGLYDRNRLESMTNDVMQILRANALSMICFVVWVYFLADVRISRLTLVLYALFSTALLIVGRAVYRSFIRKLRRRGYLLRKVTVVGDGPQIQRFLQTVEYTPGTGLQIQEHFHEPIDFLQLEKSIEKLHSDVVVLGFEDEASPVVSRFVERFYDSLFTIQVLPTERRTLIGLTSEMIGEVHVLTLNHPQFSAPDVLAKRIIDLVGSGLGLILLSPLFFLLAVVIKLTSKGPIFYGQERIGVDGERFKMWKFRSMRVATNVDQSKEWTIKNDPRRTAIGTFIRKTSIDELPQLWNVFVGQMSLVGPRPEQPYFVEKFRKEIPAYMLRHKMRAGITGWAQINGWRGDTSLNKRIECDLYYIRNWSVWLDIKILVMTFVKGFINKNAY